MNKTELNQYRGLTHEVQDLEARLWRLESDMSSPNHQRFSRTPEALTGDRHTMDALVDSHSQLVELYRAKVIELSQRTVNIERAVEAVQDPEERMVLRYRYLDGYAWEKIGHLMSYSLRNINRIHGRALQHL